MTPGRVLFVGLLAVAALLFVLNPGSDAFGEFLTDEAAARAEGSDTVSRFLQGRTGRKTAQTLGENAEHENYYLATVYTIDMNGRMPGGEQRYLGIAGWFTPLESDESRR